MKTFLYNIETRTQISSTIEGRYLVDGEPGALPEGIVELTVKETVQPVFNAATKKIAEKWEANLETNQWVQSWEIQDLTTVEIAMFGWHHPEFVLRIVAPDMLLIQAPGVETWARYNGLPVVAESGQVYLYCNTILPQHQVLLTTYQEIITIENRP